jgi:hypothetical protein
VRPVDHFNRNLRLASFGYFSLLEWPDAACCSADRIAALNALENITKEALYAMVTEGIMISIRTEIWQTL